MQNIDYLEIKVPAKAMSRKMPKLVLHGPQILTTPLDKYQTVPSISDDDDDDGQKSFEDTCFSSEDENVPDLILVVKIQTKRGRGRGHGRSTAT